MTSSSFPDHEGVILLFHSLFDVPPVILRMFMIFACLICNHAALHPSCQYSTAIKALCTVLLIGIFEFHDCPFNALN